MSIKNTKKERKIKIGDAVLLHVETKLESGELFDSTKKRGKPALVIVEDVRRRCKMIKQD